MRCAPTWAGSGGEHSRRWSDTLTYVSDTDLRFWFDPVCPFAWLTSQWVRSVARQRDYVVEWRFISLRQINAHIDYDSHFPPEYEAGHTAGLKLLRVCAKARADHGAVAVGPLYEAMGAEIWEHRSGNIAKRLLEDPKELLATAVGAAALPLDVIDALEDTGWDEAILAESNEALALTGKDVGTPILQFAPPTGTAFFGPVISRVPDDEDALKLWDHVIGLATFPGFAEMKRSLREVPRLKAWGVEQDGSETVKEEDWHAGSRRLKK